jgi:hypothetical protein
MAILTVAAFVTSRLLPPASALTCREEDFSREALG